MKKETLSRVHLQVPTTPPQGCPQWTLFGYILKPTVISGSKQRGFGNYPSLPMTPLLHKRPTFLCLAFPGSDAPCLLISLVPGNDFLRAYFNARSNRDGMSAKSSILC